MFTRIEFIKFKSKYCDVTMDRLYPNWKQSESMIDFFFNHIEDHETNTGLMIDATHQVDSDSSYLSKELEENRHDRYVKEALIKNRKQRAMLDLWKEQSSEFFARKKICIKKRWQSLFPRLSKHLIQEGCIKRIKSLVNTELTTFPHKLAHVTQFKIPPAKIAQWKAETAHVLALVEEKITLVKQVMKWKDIAGEFHNKNCVRDDHCVCEYGCECEPNFDACHPDCEYHKYYFITN
jgi:hypothetical protein